MGEALGVQQSYEDTNSLNAGNIGFFTDIQSKHNFYYCRLDDGSGYYLFSYGPDDQPFTVDDIFPEVPTVEVGRLGLVTPTPDLR